jgi:hypothetical protein
MAKPTTHLLLTIGADRADAQTRVEHFFARNFLVRYDRVTVQAERTGNAGEGDFWGRLETGIAANRRLVVELLEELRAGGFENLTDLAGMRQGYDSKLLHAITHFLDGFFGVDTIFYNLEEDSHGVSDRLTATIQANPAGFWLVEAECASANGHDADRLDLIRKFATEPPEA